MKKIFYLAPVLFLVFSYVSKPAASPYLVDLAKSFSKDIFQTNGVAYMKPVVEVVNSVSNSRFFNSAFIPREVDKPYFKVSLNGMMGFVPDSKKTYSPKLPNQQLTLDEAQKYFDISTLSVKDTAGLIYLVFKGMMYDGLQDGSIQVPQKSATALGHLKSGIPMPDSVLLNLFHNLSIGSLKLYNFLPQNLKDTMDALLIMFPDYFTMAEGANLSQLFAGVPQVEIGSFYGTELLLRFIPPVNMGETVGDFAFWGIGLKHNISQYFNYSDKLNDRLFDLSAQVVYQGTSLENKIGITQAELKANATIWDFNIHASKSFEDIIDIYTGISYEIIDISTEYKYFLPVELQYQLGLRKYDPVSGQLVTDPPEYPGDTDPQTAKLSMSNTNFKWIGGVSRQFGNFGIHADFSISTINLITLGIEYIF